MRALLELFSLKKIRGKLFILTTLLTLIPMFLLSFAVYQISADRLVKNAESHAFATGGIADHYLERIIVDFNDLFNVIISNSQIQCTLTEYNDQVCQNANAEVDSDNSEYNYLRKSYRINNAMNTITQTKSYVIGFVIYHMTAPPERRLYGSYIDPSQAEQWFADLNASGSTLQRNGWSLDQNKSSNDDRAVIGKLLRETTGDFDTLGFVLLEIDKAKFFEGLTFLNANQQARFMITDHSGELLYALPNDEDEYAWNKAIYASAMKVKLHPGEFVPLAGNLLATSQKNARSGWSIIHVIDAGILSEDARSIREIAIWIFAATLIAGLILANWISGTIRNPLHKLSLLIKMNNTLVPPSQVHFDPTDEVGQIGQRFLRMVDENKALDQQVYNALVKRKEAEIQALQAQINPHFLYNTLESLNWLAISRNQFEMSEVIGALGKFFRLTFNKGNEIITIQEELDHVQYYLRVQNFRYTDKFDFFLSFEDELSNYYVPKFILQPIVENCIYHGLKQIEGQGTIVISGELRDEAIWFHITDDGQGIQPDRLEEITTALELEETNLTYGLKNVHDRLKLSYGHNYGVHITSEYGMYTTVTLKIPAITEMRDLTDGSNGKGTHR